MPKKYPAHEFTRNAKNSLAMLELIKDEIDERIRGTEYRYGRIENPANWGDVGDAAQVSEALLQLLVGTRIRAGESEEDVAHDVMAEVTKVRARRE